MLYPLPVRETDPPLELSTDSSAESLMVVDPSHPIVEKAELVLVAVLESASVEITLKWYLEQEERPERETEWLVTLGEVSVSAVVAP